MKSNRLKKITQLTVLSVLLGSALMASAASVPTTDKETQKAVQKANESITSYLKAVNDYLGVPSPSNGGSKGSGYEGDLGDKHLNLKDKKATYYQSNAVKLTKDQDLKLKNMNSSDKDFSSNKKLEKDVVKRYYQDKISVLCDNSAEVDPTKLLEVGGATDTANNNIFENAWSSIKKSTKGILGGSDGKDAEKLTNGTAKTVVADSCAASRNLLAYQLDEIFQLTTTLELRNDLLQNYLENTSYSTSAELARHHYEITVLQTLIQNDLLRLQAALAAYDTKIKFFKQLKEEAQYIVVYGSKKKESNFSLGGLAGNLAQIGASTAALSSAKKVATSNKINDYIGSIAKKFGSDDHY